MSGPNFSSVVLPATSIASAVDSSAVVSAIGTSRNQDPSLPGCRPMRTNCAFKYSTVYPPPGGPGPADRTSDGQGKRVNVRGALGGSRITRTKKNHKHKKK